MTEKKSLLEELYTDGGEIDAQSVVDALKPILTIQRGGEAVFFTKEGHALKNEDKILAFCLAKKLLKNEGAIESSGVSGKAIFAQTGIAEGTVYPMIQRLKASGFLAGKGSEYEIPARKVDAVITRLSKGNSKT